MYKSMKEILDIKDDDQRLLGEIKYLEDYAVKYTSQMLYYSLKGSPSARILNIELKDPQTAQDYIDNLQKMCVANRNYINNDIYKAHFLFLKDLAGRIIPVFQIFKKINNLRDNEQDLKHYSYAIEILNNKALKNIEDVCKVTKTYPVEKIGSIDQYYSIVESFTHFIEKISEFTTQISKEEPKSDVKQNIVKFEASKSTQSRLKAIETANSLYEEFCQDFLRDLEKQYALSSKDLYEEFVNVKFKKFREKHNFPLSNDVSEGYANECIAQIKKLMDIVSEISANSYVTSTFGK